MDAKTEDKAVIGKEIFICELESTYYEEERDNYVEGSTRNCSSLKEGYFCNAPFRDCSHKKKITIKESTQKDLDLRKLASFVYNWCVQIDTVGSSWDDWDEYFKEAFYNRPKSGEDSEYDFCKMINKYRKMEIR